MKSGKLASQYLQKKKNKNETKQNYLKSQQ